jgi:hypothetical protein
MCCFATWQNFTKTLPVNAHPFMLSLALPVVPAEPTMGPKSWPKKPQKLASESHTRYASQPEFQVNVESEEAQ